MEPGQLADESVFQEGAESDEEGGFEEGGGGKGKDKSKVNRRTYVCGVVVCTSLLRLSYHDLSYYDYL
jgi:hypothetical protein